MTATEAEAPHMVYLTSRLHRAAGSGIARAGGLLVAIVVVMAVFAILSDGLFLRPNNLLGLLRYTGTLAIVGLGLTTVLIVGEIDLSFGYLYGLSTMFTAVAWIRWGWPLYVAVGASFAIAIVVGLFNAFFTSVVRIPSFIATLGSGTLIFGVTLLVSKSQTYNPAYPPPGTTVDPGQLRVFRGLANQSLPFGLPMQAVWMIGIALIFGFLLSKSLFGFRLKAIGGNERAAEMTRLPVLRYKMWAFVIAAMMAALGGLLDFSFIGSVQPNAGQGLLFPIFSAVIIGGASLSGGRGTVIGTLSGALLLAIIANGLALIAAGSFVQQMFLGTVTIGAVVLDQLTQRRRRR